MADATRATKARKAARRREQQSNAVAGLSVVGLVVLSVFDLQNTAASVPTFIYYGLIGAALGAKWEAVIDRIFGGKR